LSTLQFDPAILSSFFFLLNQMLQPSRILMLY